MTRAAAIGSEMDLTVHDVLCGLENGSFSSEELVSRYLARISETNDDLRAVLQVSPKALQDARSRDRQRRDGADLGPLHGVPVIIKATFATEPYFEMDTISGNYALVGSRPRNNAVAVQKVHLLVNTTGIVQIPAGWSPVGGQGQNPYIKSGRQFSDPVFSINGPGGSSSGPSIAVAAGYTPVALGEETSGSLVFPADRAALYTIKATVGAISQVGQVSVSHRFDVAGPLAKSSRDVALLLDVLVDHTKSHVPTEGYISCAKGASAWSQFRIGVVDPASWLYPDSLVGWSSDSKTRIIHEVSAAYNLVGTKAKSLKTVAFVNYQDASAFSAAVDPLMWPLCVHDFKQDFDLYLAGVDNCKISCLKDILTPDDKYAAFCTPYGECGREALERCLYSSMDEAEANSIEAKVREASRAQGIDAVLREQNVDVILGPGSGTLYAVAAAAGYPIATLPLSYLEENGCPFGLVALASARQENMLVAIQSAWEETFPRRRPPISLK